VTQKWWYLTQKWGNNTEMGKQTRKPEVGLRATYANYGFELAMGFVMLKERSCAPSTKTPGPNSGPSGGTFQTRRSAASVTEPRRDC
jgi:hypothetical protein